MYVCIYIVNILLNNVFICITSTYDLKYLIVFNMTTEGKYNYDDYMGKSARMFMNKIHSEIINVKVMMLVILILFHICLGTDYNKKEIVVS